VVLLFYCIVAVLHIIYSVWAGLSSQSWDTVAEVVALAMQSQPTEKLKNTSAGISSTAIFKHNIKVRKTGEDGKRLEMLFDDDGGAGCIVPDDFYE